MQVNQVFRSSFVTLIMFEPTLRPLGAQTGSAVNNKREAVETTFVLTRNSETSIDPDMRV